jgi:hypothetical protein
VHDQGSAVPGEIRTLVKTARTERSGTISPDERWLALRIQRVRSVRGLRAALSGRVRRSVAGFDLRWRARAGAAWAASVPQPIVKGRYVLDAVSPFDVSIDGTRFVLIKEAASAAESTGPALWSWSTGRRS